MKRYNRRGGPIWPDGLPEKANTIVRRRNPRTGDVRPVTVLRVDREGPGTIIDYTDITNQ